MVVKDLMSTGIRTVLPDASGEAAAEIMRAEDVGIVPVCDAQNHLLGILTDRDLIVRRGLSRPVSETMTCDVQTVSSRMDIHDAALLFSKHGIRRLPVVDGDKLVGMLSLKDLARKKIFTAEIGHIVYHVSNYEQKVH